VTADAVTVRIRRGAAEDGDFFSAPGPSDEGTVGAACEPGHLHDRHRLWQSCAPRASLIHGGPGPVSARRCASRVLCSRPMRQRTRGAAASLPYPPTTTAEFALRDHACPLGCSRHEEVPAHRGRSRLSRVARECGPAFASAQRGDRPQLSWTAGTNGGPLDTVIGLAYCARGGPSSSAA